MAKIDTSQLDSRYAVISLVTGKSISFENYETADAVASIFRHEDACIIVDLKNMKLSNVYLRNSKVSISNDEIHFESTGEI